MQGFSSAVLSTQPSAQPSACLAARLLQLEAARQSAAASMASDPPVEWVDRFNGQPRKGCDILVQALEREGVDTLFAYPGGASMEIHQALTRSGSVRNILCRHEQVCAAWVPWVWVEKGVLWRMH